MTNNKITIAQAKQQITEGYSSILTREDVLHLLDCLETTGTGKLSLDPQQIKDLSNDIADGITSEGIEIINDYDLSMNYKEVELDNVDFDTSRIVRTVEDIIKDFISNLEEEDEE